MTILEIIVRELKRQADATDGGAPWLSFEDDNKSVSIDGCIDLESIVAAIEAEKSKAP